MSQEGKKTILMQFFGEGGGGQKRCIMGTAKLTNTGQPAHVYKLRDTMQGSDALYCVS